MKKHLIVLASLLVGFTVVTARAQPGRGLPGPSWDGAMAKLFGYNTSFSATLEFHMTQPSGEEMTMSGKMSHVEGKARVEMDMSTMMGSRVPPQAAARMKQMGMSRMISLTRRDQNLTYMVYPDMKAYAAIPFGESNTPASEFHAESTKLGEESIDGHDCIKNKMVVTGPNGFSKESTVWNATDMKQFPIKIETTTKEGRTIVMLFKDVKLEKQDDALFDPPADFTKYDSVTSMMMSRARGAPPQ
jgi:hypothetical protein